MHNAMNVTTQHDQKGMYKRKIGSTWCTIKTSEKNTEMT